MKNNKIALISVFNKEGLIKFAKTLQQLGYKIISTGGTAKVLNENKINVIPIQKITGNPECFDGRMKTISFQIESGILFDRKNPIHVKQAQELKIKPIDLVVCNLYPFEKTIQKPDVSLDEAIENIDVGGPTMVRAAAKNFKNVLVVVNPADYEKIIEGLKNKSVDDNFRQTLAAKAFGHLSFYDSQIAKFLNHEQFPQEITLAGRKSDFVLRYGENPHQKGAIYFEPQTSSPLKGLKHHAGRFLSHVNVTDIVAGTEVVRLFKEPTAVIIKHNSPCGIALGKNPKEALMRTIKADPISAFGGVIVLNKPIDEKIVSVISKFKDEYRANIDIFAAPGITQKAIKNLSAIRKTMGIYTFGKLFNVERNLHARFFDGGFLLQNWDDNIDEGFKNWKVVTKVKPTKKQLKQMQLAWKFLTRIRSNSVIVVDKTLPMTRGIGAGQTSRIESTNIALRLAGKYVKQGILASDSFFPFDDSVKQAAKYGIGAIVQQGGSIHDQDSIDAANKAGIPMIFTNRRAFWH
ncbi:MAG: bifunctional phosphoribosylaminoimidazolecarboxamide formyltransferase/IMP cyclohydrolase [Candidatus Roizmanbacteria bacterium]|nr:MAG: bifunctional phosphoribosylaminoimidazolecarboxamide formyltransferase/IMP cyclohydrolase [Candidatus Roizmanbacteria bacterium]